MATTLSLLTWLLLWQNQPVAASATPKAASVSAQTTAAPVPAGVATPKGAKERIELAAKTNGLAGLGVPWHLKATYQLFGSDLKVAETGTYEEWWASAQRYRIAMHSATDSREEFATDHGTFETNQTGWGRKALSSIQRSVENPISIPANLEKYRLTNHEEKNGSANVPCTEITGAGLGNVLKDSYCFAPTNAVIVYASNSTAQTTFGQFASARGQTFARDIQILLLGQLWLRVNVDAVEGIGPAGMDAFQVPANAKPGLVRSGSPGLQPPTIRKGADPVYPPEAKQKNAQGVVVVSGVVGTDGHVSELEAFAGPEVLHRAALDCVQKWIFNPAEYEGKPVPVEIQVNVSFRAP